MTHRKIAACIAAGLENALEYRADYFFSTVSFMASLIVDALVWIAVYGSRPGMIIVGYDLPGLLAYIVAAQFVLRLSEAEKIDAGIARDIRDGRMSGNLLRPLWDPWYRVSTFIGTKISLVPGVVLPYLAVFVVFRGSLGSRIDPSRLGAFALSVMLALLLSFAVSYLIGMASFWMLEISSLFFVKNWIAGFLAGGLVPVDMFPEWLKAVSAILPFRYMADFPVKVLLGAVTWIEAAYGFAAQVTWIAGIVMAISVLWPKGLRKYEAVGG